MLLRIVLCIMAFSSCTGQCYEIVELKETIYDATSLEDNNTVNEDHIISEEVIDYKNNTQRHFYNSEFSYSENYFGIEIVERATNRRFVKRGSDEIVEQMRHQDNPFLSEAKPTGKMIKIGLYDCEEYILKSKNSRPNLLYYVSKKHPFIYLYNQPYQFPGFVVSSQGYAGEDIVIERTYDLRAVSCNGQFNNSIDHVKEMIKK